MSKLHCDHIYVQQVEGDALEHFQLYALHIQAEVVYVCAVEGLEQAVQGQALHTSAVQDHVLVMHPLQGVLGIKQPTSILATVKIFLESFMEKILYWQV